MRVLHHLVLCATLALASMAATAAAKTTFGVKTKSYPITPDTLIPADYTSPKVKAFSIRLMGWGYMADGHNDPVRRLMQEQQEVSAAPRELAPVEYVRRIANVVLDPAGNPSAEYGQVSAAANAPLYTLGIVFNDANGNNPGLPNNGLVYNIAGGGARTVGIISGVNGPDWPQPKGFRFRAVQHFNATDDLIMTFYYKTKGWNPYYAITSAPSPAPIIPPP